MTFSRFVLIFPALFPLPLPAGDLPVITIRTPAAQMKYDKSVITAKPGTQVRLVFENLDEMPHNWVLCQPLPDKNDKGMEVAQLAWQMGAAGNDKAWIPDSPRIIAHTGMVTAHGREELVIKVPDLPGTYPYVCTFPGHAMAMNGELRVLAAGPEFSKLDFKLYLGDWKQLPDFSALTPHRSGAIAEKQIIINLEGMTERFGVRYDGVLEVPEDGNYTFYLASDDGSELFLGGSSVIKHDGMHPAADVRTARLKLVKGPMPVRLDYFEAAGEEQLYLAWSGAKFAETPLSAWVPPGRIGNDGVKAAENEFPSLPLVPENGEALIYRNFISGVSPRGIAVGYPNGVNVCFDADQMAPAMFWQGAFIDAGRHWTGRGGGTQPPLGYNVFKPAPAGPALALLPTADTAWPPAKDRADLLRFRGYRLDAKRFPAFKYEMGSVTVTESYRPAGSTATNDLRVTRSLYFLAPQPTSDLYVRVAAGGITPSGPDRWNTEGGYYITVNQGQPVLRQGTGATRGQELLVPVIFTGGTAVVAVTYHWNP